jgi:hypothetical protein
MHHLFSTVHSFQGILPGQGQERKRAKAAAAANSKEKNPPASALSLKAAEKPRVKPKPKPAKPLIPVVQPMWTKLSNVPREVTFEHLEERMYIREFMHRFSSLMTKEARAHLDELGEIVGDGSVDWAINETQPKKGQDAPDIPLVSWVGEKCIRSVVFGLLGIYADDSTGSLKKVCLPLQSSQPTREIMVPVRVSRPLSRKSRTVRQT